MEKIQSKDYYAVMMTSCMFLWFQILGTLCIVLFVQLHCAFTNP